jgi:hypothetical protein
MTPDPSPPNRRRRRIIVSIAVLAGLSLTSWWYWPRGDARFVGKWQLSTDPYGYWDLRSNGVAVWMLNRPPHGRAYTRWRVSGDQLEVGRDENLKTPRWIEWLIGRWNSTFPRRQLLDNAVILRLLKIEPDRLSTVEVHFDVSQQTWFDTQRRILLTRPSE